MSDSSSKDDSSNEKQEDVEEGSTEQDASKGKQDVGEGSTTERDDSQTSEEFSLDCDVSSIASSRVRFLVPSGSFTQGQEVNLISSSCERQKNGSWTCRPTKIEILEQAQRGDRIAVIQALRDLGVKVFVIDGSVVKKTIDIVSHIKRISSYVARENTVEPFTGPLGFQRCLLYKDKQGRLFNLTLPQHAIGPVGRWQEYLETFSVTEAVVALTVLCRSFPCMAEGTESSKEL
jgi:hypothetical protein